MSITARSLSPPQDQLMSAILEPISTPNRRRGMESDLNDNGFSETGDVRMLGDLLP